MNTTHDVCRKKHHPLTNTFRELSRLNTAHVRTFTHKHTQMDYLCTFPLDRYKVVKEETYKEVGE
jgi:hypothetical protein